ncbi:MAG: hypothetical protein HZB11_02900 [Candidatus Yonathbacteria bacterium]|nr:hypothetical protein [Candidatus Yonathbacteria bacterium]
MQTITHRGLDPSIKDYFVESSREAFKDQLTRGFGLEFDLQLTKDNRIIILHDSTLSRISNEKDERKICQVTEEEILSMEFRGCHLVSFDTLLTLIQDNQAPNAISAIHLKQRNQDKETLDIILSYLEHQDTTKFLVFDVTLETAKYIKGKNSKINLAPSVAHPFDIVRYGSAVGGTLMDLETALKHKDLFSWVWLDEWDITGENNCTKLFYTEEVFNKIRKANIKIGLVTPELHATSPNLLGGEGHPDAADKDGLFARIKEIIKLKPDAICTDYPDYVNNLSKQRV